MGQSPLLIAVAAAELTGARYDLQQNAAGAAISLEPGGQLELSGAPLTGLAWAGSERMARRAKAAAMKILVLGAGLVVGDLEDARTAGVHEPDLRGNRAPAQVHAPEAQPRLQRVRDALGASVLNPKRLGSPPEYANLALCMIENGYFNGEDVRLDGAIRMAPR